MNNRLPYRSDVDGLRALAILLVVLFHLRIPAIGGGFVGVDVFFVISGFVVTRSIWPKARVGELGLQAFYARRFWRLQPSFFLVALATLAASSQVLAPDDFRRAVHSAAASTGLSANFFFWLQTSGYEGVDAQLEPFLQMWSLAVEEQFYLLWPFLLTAVARVRPLRKPVVIAFLLLIATGGSEWLTRTNPGMAYYLLPARVFEFAVGGLLVTTERYRPGRTLAIAGGIVGLALVVGSACWLTTTSPFPGFSALVPCLGTAALIQCGTVATPVGWLLTSRVAIALGRVSYGWYLWHWAPIALFTYAGHEMTWTARVQLGLGSLVVAGLSYRFWETPTRRSPSPAWRSAAYVTGLALVAATGALLVRPSQVAIGLHDTPDLPDVFATSPEDGHFQPLLCLFDAENEQQLDACTEESPSEGRRLLLWGDSHAGAYEKLLRRHARELGWRTTTVKYTGCPPLFGVRVKGTSGYGKYCQGQIARQVDALLQRHRFDAVLLVARFDFYEHGWIRDGRLFSDDSFLSDDHTAARDAATSALVLRRHIVSTVRYLNETHGLPVIFALPHPVMPMAPPRDRNRTMSVARSTYLASRDLLDEALDKVADDVIRLDPLDAVCDATQCPAWNGTISYYRDDNHLSPAGAARLLPLLASALSRAGEARQASRPASAPSPSLAIDRLAENVRRDGT